MAAKKMVIIVDGVQGVFIPLRDGRIATDNPQNGQVLMFDTALGEFVNKDIDYNDIGDAPDFHIYRNLTGTAAVTTSPYTHTKWDVTDSSITSYKDGMVVCVKVPANGLGSKYGTGFQINSLGYKPVVYDVNTMVEDRYPVNSVVWMTYNISITTAKLYKNSASASTVPGCWQVMDNAPLNYIPYSAAIMDNNDFGGKKLYIDNIDNAFYLANQRYWVKVTTHLQEYNGEQYPKIDSTKTKTDADYWIDSPVVSTIQTSEYAFNADYDTSLICPAGRYMKVHIQFAPFTDDWNPAKAETFSGYPYGYYFISYHNYSVPKKASEVRIYNRHSTGTGWNKVTANTYIGEYDNNSQYCIEKIPVNSYYGRSCVEFIIYARDSGQTSVNGINYFLNRGSVSKLPVVTKFVNQELYKNFSWYKHNENTANELTAKIEAETGTITAKDFVGTNLSANKFVKTDAKKKLVSEDITSSDVSGLAPVATSGNYNDLTNKPDIPTVRTVNHEQLKDSTLGDANLHDGFYFPNAVHDYDGNWYGAVVVGDQVWLAENLRTTHYADGTAITQADVSSTTEDPRYFAPQGMDPAVYGLYYNWNAVMNGEDGSDTNPSGVQGIAMDGWHIPSKSECEQLKGYVEKQSRYNYGNGKSAKALSATSGWTDSDIEDTPGNNKNENNAAGLNIIAAGRVYNILDYQQRLGYLWTSTDFISEQINIPFYCAVSYQYANLVIDNIYNRQGMSVRCVSDLTPVQFRDWYVRQYGSLQHKLDEVFRCEMLAKLPDGTLQNNVTNADVQAAVAAGKTVLCTLFDDLTNKPTLLISTEGTPMKLTGSSIHNSVLYCFEATPVSGSNWTVQYKAIQTNSQLPALTGNGGKVLSVNNNGDEVEWTQPFSGSYGDLTDKPVNASFGTGIVQASVNNTSATIAVPFSNYNLVTGGIVSVRFTNDVPANAKLNINGKGAYPIHFRGSVITAGVILADDRCLFMYNHGNHIYHLLSNDRWGVGV